MACDINLSQIQNSIAPGSIPVTNLANEQEYYGVGDGLYIDHTGKEIDVKIDPATDNAITLSPAGLYVDIPEILTQCEITSDVNGLRLNPAIYDALDATGLTGTIVNTNPTSNLTKALVIRNNCKLEVYVPQETPPVPVTPDTFSQNLTTGVITHTSISGTPTTAVIRSNNLANILKTGADGGNLLTVQPLALPCNKTQITFNGATALPPYSNKTSLTGIGTDFFNFFMIANQTHDNLPGSEMQFTLCEATTVAFYWTGTGRFTWDSAIYGTNPAGFYLTARPRIDGVVDGTRRLIDWTSDISGFTSPDDYLTIPVAPPFVPYASNWNLLREEKLFNAYTVLNLAAGLHTISLGVRFTLIGQAEPQPGVTFGFSEGHKSYIYY